MSHLPSQSAVSPVSPAALAEKRLTKAHSNLTSRESWRFSHSSQIVGIRQVFGFWVSWLKIYHDLFLTRIFQHFFCFFVFCCRIEKKSREILDTAKVDDKVHSELSSIYLTPVAAQKTNSIIVQIYKFELVSIFHIPSAIYIHYIFILDFFKIFFLHLLFKFSTQFIWFFSNFKNKYTYDLDACLSTYKLDYSFRVLIIATKMFIFFFSFLLYF